MLITPSLKIVFLGAIMVVTLPWGVSAQEKPQMSPSARRAILLKAPTKGAAAVSTLASALQDENLVVRRTAVRLLVGLGKPALPALVKALGNSDALVRRAALSSVCTPPTAEVLPHLAKAIGDPDPAVRLTAINLLVEVSPRTQPVTDLLERARQDDFASVREVAARATWPFFKEMVSVRERKDWDHDIKVLQTIPLPLEGWRFKTDPKVDGHLQKWYLPEYDDVEWAPIKIGAAWEEQGQSGYDGFAWYRGRFELPTRPEHLAVELVFEAVDEVAWIWVNGEYVGQHDLGTEGWNLAFTVDVTREVKWGESNQITVRVFDSAYAGGIWKPVSVQVLQ